METEASVFTLMLLFLGLGSSLIHYSKAAKVKAKAIAKSNLDINKSNEN
jgi:hypothetical protein